MTIYWQVNDVVARFQEAEKMGDPHGKELTCWKECFEPWVYNFEPEDRDDWWARRKLGEEECQKLLS
jgi:hypothetical protein